MKTTLNNLIIKEIKEDEVTDSGILTSLKKEDLKRRAIVMFDAKVRFVTNTNKTISFTVKKGTEVYLSLYVGVSFEYEDEEVRKILYTDITGYAKKEIEDYKVVDNG